MTATPDSQRSGIPRHRPDLDVSTPSQGNGRAKGPNRRQPHMTKAEANRWHRIALLLDGRIRITKAGYGHIVALCWDGVGKPPLKLGFDGGWWCACPSTLPTCKHIDALRLVVSPGIAEVPTYKGRNS